MILTTFAKTNDDLESILELQAINHVHNLTQEEKNTNGFVTVKHDFDLLKSMSKAALQIIAKDNDKVIAYALVMLPEFRNKIPVLMPMFDMIDELEYQNKKIALARYYVMGQICIAETHRGMGIFDELYQMHKKVLSKDFDYCITEVSVNNIGSMKAHTRVGFKTIKTYQDETDTWNIMLWDFM
jgi:ribosomal protein S18 acetylase RimI-like enzyme